MTGRPLRILIMLSIFAGLAFGIAACGKKNAPVHPAGSEFPRKYPSR
ncbi:MAG: hypothetical protein RJQ21_10925 [Rhodospirillales bacterium]